MMGTIWIHLPYPPSVNHYFRNVRGRTLISRQGREYRKAVCRLLADRGLAPMQGPVGMLLQAHPPDRRRRDLDNLMKAVWDSL
ncbi:MAG: RusA family crossover junction endodeoxyribonuclease, partial [Planctomycetota bacterium]